MDNAKTFPRSGCFYAVGVGPGAPDLLTLRAARVLQEADIIHAPRAACATASMALEIIGELDIRGEVVECEYPMTRDIQQTRQMWKGVAERIAAECNAGQCVAQITIGDPTMYSTSGYLLDALADRLPREQIHVIPGIGAHQAAAARFAETLCRQEDRMMIMPGNDLGAVEKALGQCETLILYKVAKCISGLKALLKRRGLLDSARLACYVEQPAKEMLIADLNALPESEQGYLSTMLIRIRERGWNDIDAIEER